MMDTPNTPHSPLPWSRPTEDDGDYLDQVQDPSGFPIAVFTSREGPNAQAIDEANAALCVHRVNHFDELLSALKAIPEQYCHMQECECPACDFVWAAIKAVEGEQ